MIIANTEHGIALRWRDEQGKREEKLVGFSDFSPYFFVKEDCPVVVDSVSSIQLYESWGDRGSTFPLELRYEFGDWVNLDGDKLAVLAAARITGYGAEYEITTNCDSCGKDTEFLFDDEFGYTY